MGTPFRVPHVGWSSIVFARSHPLFSGIKAHVDFYFVHSYYVVPEQEEVVAGTADYPEPFCAMVWRDNLFATQFHPEKSQQNGLKALKNFAELALVR